MKEVTLGCLLAVLVIVNFSPGASNEVEENNFLLRQHIALEYAKKAILNEPSELLRPPADTKFFFLRADHGRLDYGWRDNTGRYNTAHIKANGDIRFKNSVDTKEYAITKFDDLFLPDD